MNGEGIQDAVQRENGKKKWVYVLLGTGSLLVAGGIGYMIGSSGKGELEKKLESTQKNYKKLSDSYNKTKEELEKLKESLHTLKTQQKTGLDKLYLPFGEVNVKEYVNGTLLFKDILEKGLDDISKDKFITIEYNGKQVTIDGEFKGTVLAEAISKVYGLNYTGLEYVMNEVVDKTIVAKIHDIEIINKESGLPINLEDLIAKSSVIDKNAEFKVIFETENGKYVMKTTRDNILTLAYLMHDENVARLLWGDTSAEKDLKNLHQFLENGYQFAFAKTKNETEIIGFTKTYVDLNGNEKDRGIIVLPGKILEKPPY